MKKFLASTVNFLVGFGPALFALSYLLVDITDQNHPYPYAGWEKVIGYIWLTLAALGAGWVVQYLINYVQGATHQTAKQKMAEEWIAILGSAAATVIVEILAVFIDIQNFYAMRIIGFIAFGAGVALWLVMWAYGKLKTKK